MTSKRYKKLPEKTKDLNAESIEKLLPELKKNCTTKFDESLDLRKAKLTLEQLLIYLVEQERK
jgi:ribosomal protein L1